MCRAMRRKYNIKKSLRKQRIAREVYGHDWYDNLHQYSKNKVHCSCGMCRFKSTWQPDNKTISDIKKEQSQLLKLKEYVNENVA